MRTLAALAAAIVLAAPALRAEPERLRVMTFNLKDLRPRHIEGEPLSSRAQLIALIIQELRPDVLLLNEIAYDFSDDPELAGATAKRFAEQVLAEAHDPEGPEPIRYQVFTAPVNTGVPSGFDLDNNGVVVETPETDGYAGDAIAWGWFPGQYGMALLVREGLEILETDVRTFREFLWKDMPGALLPPAVRNVQGPEAQGWYTDEELAVLRLSSKSHWDIPVRTESGAIVHFIAAHTVPPAFDGPEDRNGRRNHDEIRLIADYLADADYLVDDQGRPGGLHPEARFIILGDLNADPEKGDSRGSPMQSLIFSSPRVQALPAPRSVIEIDGLAPTDTASFALRVDYVLPSNGITHLRSGVWRGLADSRDGQDPAPLRDFPTDHFPVWMDIEIP